MPFLRRAQMLWALIFCLSFYLLIPTTVKADPHAVFYTAIGQQQLFFNILAALDQADYVEPANITAGTPPGTSREDLLKRREDAGRELTEDDTPYPPETFPIAEATETQLAGLLTRSITLEGQDMWTSFLLREAFKEDERRDAVGKVTDAFCNVSQGSCSGEKTPDEAFATNPNEAGQKGITGGVAGALFSDTDPNSYDQQRRKTELENQLKGGRADAIAFDPSIATLRAEAETRGGWNQVVEGYANDSFKKFQQQPIVGQDTLNTISVDSETLQASFSDNYTSGSQRTNAISDFLRIGPTTDSIALGGFTQVAGDINATTEDGGYKAETLQSAETFGVGGIGSISPVTLRPAGAGPAVVAGLTSGIVSSEGNPSDVKLTNEEKAKENDCTVDTNGICIKATATGQINSFCFYEGDAVNFSFDISTTDDTTQLGVVTITALHYHGDGTPTTGNTYSPSGSRIGYGSSHFWGRQTIEPDPATYSVIGKTIDNPGNKIGYRVNFRYNYNGLPNAIRSVSANAVLDNCNFNPSTASTSPASQVAGAQSSVRGTQNTGTPAVAGTSTSANDKLRNQKNDYPPLYQESTAIQNFLRSLSPLKYFGEKPTN